MRAKQLSRTRIDENELRSRINQKRVDGKLDGQGLMIAGQGLANFLRFAHALVYITRSSPVRQHRDFILTKQQPVKARCLSFALGSVGLDSHWWTHQGYEQHCQQENIMHRISYPNCHRTLPQEEAAASPRQILRQGRPRSVQLTPSGPLCSGEVY